MDSINYSITEDSPRLEQPENIYLSLKPHQLACAHRICSLDKDCGMTVKSSKIKVYSNVGILADIPGYGKTIEMLTAISKLRDFDQREWFPKSMRYDSMNFGIFAFSKRTKECSRTSLIVAPDNLVEHWDNHINEYTDLLYETVNARTIDIIPIEEYEVILCPASCYNNFVSRNSRHFWDRVIFDEADTIHIPNTREIKTRFLWLISATYQNIPKRRNNGFLREIFSRNYVELIDGYFYPMIVKGTDDFVKKSFNLPEEKITIIECFTPPLLNAIKSFVTSKVLEMISAGNIDGAIEAIGGNIDTNDNIIEAITKTLYNKIIVIEGRLEILEQLDLLDRERAARREILDSKLQSLKNRQKNLQESIAACANSNCSICMDQLAGATLTPCCYNLFCAECLLLWLKENKTCPLCRNIVDPSGLYKISANVKARNDKDDLPHKLDALIDILQDCKKGKFLIFSGHTQSFRDISIRLREHGLKYIVLSNSRNATKILQKFYSGQINIVLLNAQYNGAGLDLSGATDVILYHQMQENLEIQAIGRAQRPGREGQLRVWKLKYKHEWSTA